MSQEFLPNEDIALEIPRVGALGTVQRLLNGIHSMLAALSGIALGVAGCVLTWEVIGRYFLSIPSDWQDELSVFLLVGATFASAGWIQARRGHVAIDALSHLLPPSLEHARRVLADIAALLFCVFFTWKSWELLVVAWEDGQTTPSAWGAPLWIPYGCMTAGMAVLSLQLLLQVLAGHPRRNLGTYSV